MSIKKWTYGLLAFATLLSACSNSELSPKTKAEYLSWYNNPEHGFVKAKELSGLEFRVQYRPNEFLAMRELTANKSYPQTQVDSIINSYGEGSCFMLEIASTNQAENPLFRNIRDVNEYRERLTNFAFEMKEHVLLKVGEAEYSPSLWHHERGYELGSRQRILMTFPVKVEEHKKVVFEYHDEHFNAFLLKFSFGLQNKQQPSLPKSIKTIAG